MDLRVFNKNRRLIAIGNICICIFIVLSVFYYSIESLTVVTIFRNVFICIADFFLILLILQNRLLKIMASLFLFVWGLVLVLVLFYYSYFNQLPNLSTLKLSNQGFEVIGYIFSFFSIKIIILLIVLLIGCLILIFTKEKILNFKKNILLILLLLISLFISQSYNYYRLALGVNLKSSFRFEPLYSIQRNGYGIYLLQQYLTTYTTVNDSRLTNPLPQLDICKERNNKTFSNFIIIQVESLDNTLIDRKTNGREITPCLNKLKKDAIYCPNFFVQHSAGGSSDAEFTSISGLLPLSDISTMSFQNLKLVPSIAKILYKYGYESYGMHGNNGSYWNRISAYREMGFKNFYDAEDYKGKAKGFFSLDSCFLNQSVPIIKQISQKNKHFLIYIITQTMHGPYYRRKGAFETESNSKIKQKNEAVEVFFKKANYTDKALGSFIERLNDDGLLLNTNIMIFGDHTSGIKTEEYDCKKNTAENVPLIIVPAKNQKGTVYTYGSHVDIAPTILDLAGVEPSPLMCGRSLLRWSPDRLFPIALGLNNYIINPAGVKLVKNSLNPTYQRVIDYCRSYFYKTKEMKDLSSNIFRSHTFIARALGSIDDKLHTNSREAFAESYKKGIRIMAVNLVLTEKNELLCYDNNMLLNQDIMKVSKEDFLELKIDNKYSTLTFGALMKLFERYSDCNLIIDLNADFTNILSEIQKRFYKMPPALSKRIIIQINKPEQLELIRENKTFENVIFSFSRSSKMDDDDVLKFVSENTKYIKAVTVSRKRFSPQLTKALKLIKIPTFVHTINNQLEMYHYVSKGAFGFYTDLTKELTNVIK